MSLVLGAVLWLQGTFESMAMIEVRIHMTRKHLEYHLNGKLAESNTGWNDKTVALEKMIWFHFRLMETGFLFLLARCVQIPRAIGAFSCLKVTQCSTSEIGDAPLYNSCSLPIKVMKTGPLPAPSKCKSRCSTLEGTAQRIGRPFGGSGAEAQDWGHRQEGPEQGDHRKGPTIIDETPQWRGDPLVQSGGRWQTLCVAAGLGAGPQVQKDTGSASEWVLRLSTLLSLASSSPDLNLLDYFVWSYVENITNMTSHNTKASLIAAIRRVFAKLPPVFVEKASSQFRIRIEAVIEAEGGYVE